MAIERGVLIVVQSVAKLNGLGVEVAKIQVGGHIVLSSFSNQTNQAIQIRQLTHRTPILLSST